MNLEQAFLPYVEKAFIQAWNDPEKSNRKIIDADDDFVYEVEVIVTKHPKNKD